MTGRWIPVLLGVCLAVTGCNEGDRPLKVGVVDTARVIEERPEAVDIRLDWVKDASDLYLEMTDPGDGKVDWEAVRIDAEQRSARWEKQVGDFVAQAVAAVREHSSEVAREKGLDMVVVNNPYLSPVQYCSGEDITLDVILKMKE